VFASGNCCRLTSSLPHVVEENGQIVISKQARLRVLATCPCCGCSSEVRRAEVCRLLATATMASGVLHPARRGDPYSSGRWSKRVSCKCVILSPEHGRVSMVDALEVRTAAAPSCLPTWAGANVIEIRRWRAQILFTKPCVCAHAFASSRRHHPK
jgi:hypothetical protein